MITRLMVGSIVPISIVEHGATDLFSEIRITDCLVAVPSSDDPTLDVHTRPSSKGPVLNIYGNGVPVRIIKTQGDWAYVRLWDNVQGEGFNGLAETPGKTILDVPPRKLSPPANSHGLGQGGALVRCQSQE
jgi:hypothetical protein